MTLEQMVEIFRWAGGDDWLQDATLGGLSLAVFVFLVSAAMLFVRRFER